jgi:hypothetical protein
MIYKIVYKLGIELIIMLCSHSTLLTFIVTEKHTPAY